MKALIVYHKGHEKNVLSQVKPILKNNNVEFSVVTRAWLKKGHYRGKDLIIVIGGDGTFLRASHRNTNVPMFGINPNPLKKEGFFMQANTVNFTNKVHQVISKKFKTIKLLRLKVKINNYQLRVHALNEVFIGDPRPYNMFNYDFIIGKQEEFHRSSGLLIGTPAGSHAWLKSAGGKVMNLGDNKFQYFIRELYERRIIRNYKLKKGVLTTKQDIKIVCHTSGILVIDSLKPEYRLKRGDKVTICASNDYLEYIV